MKIIPEKSVAARPISDLVKSLSQIYGEDLSTDFDNKCLDRYEVLFENGEPKSVNCIYNKVKVIHSSSVGYWPIAPEVVEMNLEAGLKILRECK